MGGWIVDDEFCNCTVCGRPARYGSRHHQCGDLVTKLFNIAMYGDRGNRNGMDARIEAVLREHLAATPSSADQTVSGETNG